jgi:hypothetical protein
MFLLRGTSGGLRHGWSRRDVIRVGLGGLAGWLAPGRAAASPASPASPAARGFGRARGCIFIYLFGGPSHIDIWDMKPAAPDGIRGEFKPISTNVPGLQITEHLPLLARRAERYAIVRSLTHGDSAHGSAGHFMMTGQRPRALGEVPPTPDDFPHYGAVLARLRPPAHAVAPFVSLPQVISTSTNVVPGQNAGFLGRALDPLRLDRPPEGSFDFTPPLADLPPGVTPERLGGREELLRRLEQAGRLADDANAGELAKLYQRAYALAGSPRTAQAFRLDREPPQLRERYGLNVFGQSLLLARRLIEAGVRLVTVCWPDRTEPEAFINNGVKDPTPVPLWDTHGWKVGKTPNFPVLKNEALPPLDRASAALLDDLTARGLLDETLVVWTGEFGRSPRINGDAGRDHYGNVFSAMLAGGGVRGGQVYGSSDRLGAYPAENPVSAADFAATLYHALGIPPETELTDRLGRPQRLCPGQPVLPLFG